MIPRHPPRRRHRCRRRFPSPVHFLLAAITTTVTIAVATAAIANRSFFASAFRTLPHRRHSTCSSPSNRANAMPSTDAAASTNSYSDATAIAASTIPRLSPATLRSLVAHAVSYGAAHGLQVSVRQSHASDTSAHAPAHVVAPLSLLPQAYPRRLFVRAVSLAGPFNLLVDRIARDSAFLTRTLRDAGDVDPFTGKLLELYVRLYAGEDGGDDDHRGAFARRADRLGIHRSDYMLHRPDGDHDDEGGYELKQVELNTIAASFAGLAERVAGLHAFLTERSEGEGTLRGFLEENESAVMGTSKDGARENAPDVEDDEEEEWKRGVPRSRATTRLPAAMAIVHERYRRTFLAASDGTPDEILPVVLFVVQPGETNTVDQRLLEFRLWEDHRIPVVRLSLAEVHRRVRLDETDGRLLLLDDDDDAHENANENEPTNSNSNSNERGIRKEITLVYFRAGYAPTDYPSGYDGIEWLARETLERGRAAKCPSLGYHLAGCKKVQQELARPGVLERFFPEPDAEESVVPLLRSAFAGLYSLGADANERDLEAVRDVLFRGGEGRYVLKPQREGGGYNFYGKELADKLRTNCTIADDDETITLGNALSEFILMERLFPPQQRAVLLRNGMVEGSGMTISELGCFGTIVASAEGEVLHNEYAGFLLRTKFSGVDEGGVASGFATLSSPYLC